MRCILLDKIFKEMITEVALTHGRIEAAPQNNNSIQFVLNNALPERPEGQ
jgi:hypothetical protein